MSAWSLLLLVMAVPALSSGWFLANYAVEADKPHRAFPAMVAAWVMMGVGLAALKAWWFS